MRDSTATDLHAVKPTLQDGSLRPVLISALRIFEEHGLPVIPCNGSKQPILKDWTNANPRNDGDVKMLFASGAAELVGVRTGAVSGIFAVDVDPEGGNWFAENIARLECKRIHTTRRECGRHLLYKIPPGWRVKNSVGKLAPGVDTRGEGGQLIWWPEHGGRVVEDDVPGLPPQWLLDELVRFWIAERVDTERVNGHTHSTRQEEGSGNRNNTLTKMAGSMHRLGFCTAAISDALHQENSQRFEPPLPGREVDAIIAQADKWERGSTSAPTPCAAIDWDKLVGDPPPRTWWIKDWLGPSPTLTSGAGGTGKTRLWQAVGTALATGQRYLEASVSPLRVLMWLSEDTEDEVWRTQAPINAHFGLTMEDLKDRLHIVPRQGQDNALLDLTHGKPTFTPLLNELRQQINDRKIDVLVLDNLGQFFGGNENDRHQATFFVNGIAGLVRDRPFAPVLLGHVARSPGSEFSGSAAWENAVRMRWYVGPTLPDQKLDDGEPVDSNVIYLARRKANYAAKDWRRLRFCNGLLIPDEPEGLRLDQAARNDTAERILLDAMPRLLAAGIQPTDGRTSNDYLPAQTVAKGYAPRHSKKDLAAAMHRLMGNGRLRREVVGKYANRSPRYGLVLS
jgi:hypothetical protein